jgi:hypothetical protein
MTTVPVIGVPIQTKALGGMDSLLSIVQMPAGIPVATMAINGAKNAGLFAAQILALTDESLAAKLDAFVDSKGVIFDGFPRTIAQAEALKQMLEERGQKLTAMIDIQVAEETLMARLLRRATIEGRADDNEETIKKRFAVYHNQTAPLIEWFKGQGVYKAFPYADEMGLEGMVRFINDYVATLL